MQSFPRTASGRAWLTMRASSGGSALAGGVPSHGVRPMMQNANVMTRTRSMAASATAQLLLRKLMAACGLCASATGMAGPTRRGLCFSRLSRTERYGPRAISATGRKSGRGRQLNADSDTPVLSSRASPLARPGTQAPHVKGWVPAFQNRARALSPAGMTAVDTQKLIGTSLEGSAG